MSGQNNMPKFRFTFSRSSSAPCILAGYEVIHYVTNVDEFYMEFGYSVEIARNGMLPDEFIWEQYIKNNDVNSDNCIQIHIINYLNKHSPLFKEKYGDQSGNMVACHVAEKEARCVDCFACGMKPLPVRTCS